MLWRDFLFIVHMSSMKVTSWLRCLQMHKALVEAQGGISGDLHAAFQGMILAMQDVPAVLIVLADSLQVTNPDFASVFTRVLK